MASKRSISYSIFAGLVAATLLLAGCGAKATAIPPTAIPPSPTTLVLQAVPSATIPAGPAATEAPVAATQASIPATAEPQVLLPSETPVLANPQLVPASTSIPAGSIVFPSGATATVVQGTLLPGQVANYTIQAGVSQIMVLIMDSPNNDVTLGVFEPDGSMLLNPANKWRSWQGVLPRTELYKIQVTGGATTENYTLTVKIPQQVNFASGATSMTLNGTSVYGYPFDYSLTCGSGQSMSASLNVPSGTAFLDIFGGATSEMLLLESAKASSWTGTLPLTQPYVVEVVPNNYQVVNFSLTISCTGAVSTTGTQSGDILIKPGSTAAVKHGTVGPGQVVKYTLQASNSQPLVLNVGTVGSTKNDIYLGLIAPDGNYVFDPAKKYLNYQVPLRETGLYTIEVFGGSTTQNFELTIKLPRVVYFSGTDTVTIKSATEQGFIVSYAFYGNFGQKLKASLNVPSSTAYLDIFGIRSGGLLSYQDKANSWSGVLPDTEMVVVEVIPRGGQIVGYILTLTLK